MEKILRGLGHGKLALRVAYAYVCFFILLALSYAFGFMLLPEGIMKTLPLPALAILEERQSFPLLLVRTSGYNLLVLSLIIGLNVLRVRRFAFGYLPLFANTILMGLLAGTNSFSGGVSAYILEGWMMFLQIGFLEFSAYLLGCTATAGLTMYSADRWRGTTFKKTREWKDLSLSKQELAVLLTAIALLFIAAYNEWNHVGW